MDSSSNKDVKLHLINDQIDVSPVLLVVPEGDNLLLEIQDALNMARNRGMDLVLINGKSNPPIVKILDYGKFVYELKKQKSSKKNVIKVKSIIVKPQTNDHDIGWKADKAIEWFKTGDKVHFVVKAPGRMSERMDLINDVYMAFSKLVEEYGRPKEDLKKISKIQYATYFFPVKK